MLEVADLQVRRDGGLVLDVPRLTVSPGETLAIIGPNGAGKSTLLLTMALLLRPTAGTIYVAGEPATSANTLRLRRKMAMVFQEPLLLASSVAENVATGLRLRGTPSQERQERVSAWLERFGIAPLARRPARSLSGGEAHRTSLARALALQPAILFLDEPFSALDAPTRASVSADLLAVLRSTRTTTVLVTHDRDEALALGDRVAVLIGGQLRQEGAPEEVFGTPADPEVAGFVGIETIAPGVVLAQEDDLAQVRIGDCLLEVCSTLAKGTPVFLCLRPEDVTLLEDLPPATMPHSSARNRLTGRVIEVNPWGGQVRVVIDCGFRLAVVVTRRSASELHLSQGTAVVASFKATSAHLIPRTEAPNS